MGNDLSSELAPAADHRDKHHAARAARPFQTPTGEDAAEDRSRSGSNHSRMARRDGDGRPSLPYDLAAYSESQRMFDGADVDISEGSGGGMRRSSLMTHGEDKPGRDDASTDLPGGQMTSEASPGEVVAVNPFDDGGDDSGDEEDGGTGPLNAGEFPWDGRTLG